MAKGLLYFCGFDRGTAAADNGLTVVGPSYITIGANNNFHASGNTARIVTSSQTAYLERSLGASYTKLIIGVRIRIDLSTCNSEEPIAVYNGSTAIARIRFTNTSGDVNILNTGGTVVGANATTVRLIATNTWHYLEWSIWVNGASSETVLKVDGTEWITGTGINLGSTPMTHTNLGHRSSAIFTCEFDDWVIVDWSVSGAGYLGDRRVMHCVPDGAGNYSAWTASATATAANWECVDDAQLDSDTSYVTTAVNGDKDSYTLTGLTGIDTSLGGVDAVMTLVSAKTTGTESTIGHFLRLSSTDADPVSHSVPSTYAVSTTVWENKPGGTGWTVTDVNSLEAGIKAG